MGLIIKLIMWMLSTFKRLLYSSIPEDLRPGEGFFGWLKKPFPSFWNKKSEEETNSVVEKVKKKISKVISNSMKKILKGASSLIVAFGEVILVLIIVMLIAFILVAILGMFGAFNGKVTVNMEKFMELNQDEQVYMDAQNTNELRKSYYQYVSETSYYQMFNLRDMNPTTINPFLKVIQGVVNNTIGDGETTMTQEDLFAINKGIFDSQAFLGANNFLGVLGFDQRYVYSDANKNPLKYMKSAKVVSLDPLAESNQNIDKINGYFRDYYNRESTFMLSETLLSEMNRMLFGEYSGAESIVYPESFTKPVAFVNDYYRIQTDKESEYFGEKYTYLTQRVGQKEIEDPTSPYYKKDWLEGIIYTKPSKIVYDYAVTSKNVYNWSDKSNNTANRISYGNISKYATAESELEYKDGTVDTVENIVKLYWIVKDSDNGAAKINTTTYGYGSVTGMNPYNEHMTAGINDETYSSYFDGPYTRIITENGTVKVDPTSKITTFKFLDAEGNHVDETEGERVRFDLNKYPKRHLQLVPITDESGNIQLNSRFLLNKTYVQKKSIRESYRHFPEYYSEFSNFVEIDLARLSPTAGILNLIGDDAIEQSTLGSTYCTENDYDEDLKLPFSDRKCSIIRKYTGSRGLGWIKGKFAEFGNAASNLITGATGEAEIEISSEAMFYLLMSYEDYLIETGEYGVAWDYKYYTHSELEMSIAKAGFKDVLGLNEVFVDSWNDTRLYKDTMDVTKSLDNSRTIQTQYVPTAIISGEDSATRDGNVNLSSVGYGWRIKNDTGNPATTTFERVSGEASLEYPEYSSGKMIDILNKYLYGTIVYGEEDFRYVWNGQDVIDKGSSDVSEYYNALTDEEKASVTDYDQEKDYRNQEYVWDPDATVYRPTIRGNDGILENGTDITTVLQTGITTDTSGGKITERSNREKSLPLEVKSVRDYGLSSVLSYLEGLRVVYNTGVFMDEAYSASGLSEAFDDLGIDEFGNFKKGYYPKSLLDKYPELIDAMRTTPMAIEDLQPFAETLLALQYAATDEEKNVSDSQAELLEEISNRNINGLQITGLNESVKGFEIAQGGSALGTNLCINCSTICADKEGEEKERCMLTCVSEGGYFNYQNQACNTRCETAYSNSVAELDGQNLTTTVYDEKVAELTQKKTECLSRCETDYPDRSIDCEDTEIDTSGAGSVYAYAPYLTPTHLENIGEFLLGWAGYESYNHVQFLDPLQYYIEWFDYFAPQDDLFNKALKFISGSNLVYQLDTKASSVLRAAQYNDNASFTAANHSSFGDAGKKIRGEYKEEFYNKYFSDIAIFELISQTETYKVYMIEEAVTFLGTFTYTYRDEILSLGSVPTTKQVSSLVYADRYYYLSNYIFSIPFNVYTPQEVVSYTGSQLSYREACPSTASAKQMAKTSVDPRKLINPFSWFSDVPEIHDVKLDCFHETIPKTCTGTTTVLGITTTYTYSCPEYVMKYSVIASYSTSTEMRNLDTLSEIQVLASKVPEETGDKLIIGLKMYDALSDWSWSAEVNNNTDLAAKLFHNYDKNYQAGGNYDGDEEAHYGKLEKVNSTLGGRTGYKVTDDPFEVDSLNLPNDLNFDINYEDGPIGPTKLTNNDINEIWAAAGELFTDTPMPTTITTSFGREVTSYSGKGIIQETNKIGVGIFGANREDYGYPIPIFRHFGGSQREILPREMGYYFDGETFESWQSRLIVRDDSSTAKIEYIEDERNIKQGYLYNYIANFEAYIPFDVKSDFDLMSRGREIYNSTSTSTTNRIEETSNLSGSIFTIVSTPAWEETIANFVAGGENVNATSVAQILSGLLEVEIARAPERIIKISNASITDANKKLKNNTGNKEAILTLIRETMNNENANVENRLLLLEAEDGTSKEINIHNLGPGVIFYDYDTEGAGSISSNDFAPGQACGATAFYKECFPEANLTINETNDDRLVKLKSLEYVSSKFGRLVRKYGDLQKAIMAYFYGETYTNEIIYTYDEANRGNEWINRDDATMIALALSNITGDESITSNPDSIDVSMYTGAVVNKTMSYVVNVASRETMTRSAVVSAGGTGVNIGSRKELGQSAYNKWAGLINELSTKHDVDAALVAAYVQQESTSNSYAGVCWEDNILTDTLMGDRMCTKLYKSSSGAWLYNGGGGLGQVHHICDSLAPGATTGRGSNLASGTCSRTITSSTNGTSVTVTMAIPSQNITTIADVSRYEAIDSRVGDVHKSLEWSVIYMSNLLATYDGDYFKALVAYNAGGGTVNRLVNECGENGWYNCYASQYTPNYVEDVMRYYNETLATKDVQFSGTSESMARTLSSAFTLKTGQIHYNRDLYSYNNSGVELYTPRMNSSREMIRTMLVNNSNFGKDKYVPYDTYSLLSLFTARDIYGTETGVGGGMNWIGMNANIQTLGTGSTFEIPSDFIFANVAPVIPMNSPIGRPIDRTLITSEFGLRNFGGREMHEGLDFGLTSGTPLYSVAPGKVVTASTVGTYGKYIKIEHVLPPDTIITNGVKQYRIEKLYTGYAHMSRFDVSVGDIISDDCAQITSGARCINITSAIGLSGNTGRSSGPHLHFEVQMIVVDMETGERLPATNANKFVDPYYWLSTTWN